VIFGLPDGSGLEFNTVGISEPPKVTAKIVRDVPSKTNYTELLAVDNWLPQQQRYVHRHFDVYCSCIV